MSYVTPAPYTLTDADIAAVMSSNTVSAKLTAAGVGAALAGLTPGSVGDLAVAVQTGSGTAITKGTTYAGSTLSQTAMLANASSQLITNDQTALSGTWIAIQSSVAVSGAQAGGLFRRVA